MSRQSKCCYTVVMSSFMNVPGFSLASLLCPAAAQAAAADTWAENSEEFGSYSRRRSAASLLTAYTTRTRRRHGGHV